MRHGANYGSSRMRDLCRANPDLLRRRKVGNQIGCIGEIVNVVLQCSSCDAVQTTPLDADESITAAIKGESCITCGRLGSLRLPRKRIA